MTQTKTKTQTQTKTKTKTQTQTQAQTKTQTKPQTKPQTKTQTKTQTQTQTKTAIAVFVSVSSYCPFSAPNDSMAAICTYHGPGSGCESFRDSAISGPVSYTTDAGSNLMQVSLIPTSFPS